MNQNTCADFLRTGVFGVEIDCVFCYNRINLLGENRFAI